MSLLEISLFSILIAIIVLIVFTIIYLQKLKTMNIESFGAGAYCDTDCDSNNCKSNKCQPES
jgi:amino acid transporter